MQLIELLVQGCKLGPRLCCGLIGRLCIGSGGLQVGAGDIQFLTSCLNGFTTDVA